MMDQSFLSEEIDGDAAVSKPQMLMMVQVADVDIGVIRWFIADLLTHILPLDEPVKMELSHNDVLHPEMES